MQFVHGIDIEVEMWDAGDRSTQIHNPARILHVNSLPLMVLFYLHWCASTDQQVLGWCPGTWPLWERTLGTVCSYGASRLSTCDCRKPVSWCSWVAVLFCFPAFFARQFGKGNRGEVKQAPFSPSAKDRLACFLPSPFFPSFLFFPSLLPPFLLSFLAFLLSLFFSFLLPPEIQLTYNMA